MVPSKSSIIFSISSDTGYELAKQRLDQGWKVFGTYRQSSEKTELLKKLGVEMVCADFASRDSLENACRQLKKICNQWDELIIAPGSLLPIGLFENTDFSQWAQSIEVNFVNQICVLRLLLETRQQGAFVALFAGGGTNGTADRFSAYTVSKIALIKMVELLDSEIPDIRITIVGPGWINTKIHQETLGAGSQSGQSFEETKRRLVENDFGQMKDVIECIDWLSSQPKECVSGRNFSVQHDAWGDEALLNFLSINSDAAKLRRQFNTQISNPKNDNKS